MLASGIKTPRWLARSSDGTVYLSAHRLTAPDGPDPTEGREILRLAPDGSLAVVATGIRRLEGLVRLNGQLIAATKGLEGAAESAGKLLSYPVRADGSLGPPAEWVDTGLKQPVGLVLDALSAVYVSSKELMLEVDPAKRAIGKVHPDRHLTAFAQNLEDPQGVALGPDGALYAADGHAGRLLRFVPPAPPALDPVGPFTTQATLAVHGTTEAGARVDGFVDEAEPGVSTLADGAGAFTLTLALTPNAENAFEVFATAHAGDGLTSAPATATVTHDSAPPGLALTDPPAGTFVRQTVSVQAQASDGGSQVASLTLSAAGQALLPTLMPAPPAGSVTASASWNTGTAGDGPQTLVATATDRAGNPTTVSRLVTVDNSPPDTQITGGPSGTISEPSATVTFTGTDNLTAPGSLQFAWRLDGAAFTAFSAGTTATLTGVSEGAHTFEVKARDLAGNEDPTPATQSFTVAFGPTITAVDPASGPVGTFVTMTGSQFLPGPTQVAFTGTAAVVQRLTATGITTTVPIGATTGNLTITTPRGSASRPFTVTTTGDFTLTVTLRPAL